MDYGCLLRKSLISDIDPAEESDNDIDPAEESDF